jgi:lipoic acid synthetase
LIREAHSPGTKKLPAQFAEDDFRGAELVRVKLRLVMTDDLGLIDERAGGGLAVRPQGGFGGEAGADQRPKEGQRAKKGGQNDPDTIARRMDVQTRCNCPPIGPFMPPPMTPKIDPALHRDKKPEWIRVTLPRDPKFWSTKGLITDLKLHTVCEEAQCPNRWECWSQGSATFMIAGDRCTRACGFCAVKTAKPFALEADEPQRVAEATKRMGLNHIVITAVARDDMKDGGAEHFARTIEAVREAVPTITIEILVPDFNGKDDALEVVMKAKPHIFNHNLETVERLTPLVRSRAQYHRSLHVLKRAKAMAEELGTKCATKSGLMLGLGETETELFQAMDDLREHDVTVLTLGQYLRPSPQHLPVIEYVHPDTFENYKQIALKKGFRHVASAPLVRSSYHASDFKPELDLE